MELAPVVAGVGAVAAVDDLRVREDIIGIRVGCLKVNRTSRECRREKNGNGEIFWIFGFCI